MPLRRFILFLPALLYYHELLHMFRNPLLTRIEIGSPFSFTCFRKRVEEVGFHGETHMMDCTTGRDKKLCPLIFFSFYITLLNSNLISNFYFPLTDHPRLLNLPGKGNSQIKFHITPVSPSKERKYNYIFWVKAFRLHLEYCSFVDSYSMTIPIFNKTFQVLIKFL